jgi:hypothetical protein
MHTWIHTSTIISRYVPLVRIQLFATKAKLDISWVGTADTPLLSVRDLHQLNELVAPYLQELLSQDEDGLLGDNIPVDVNMEVADHKNKGPDELLLESLVTVWYLGHEPMDNFSFVLEQVLIRQNGLPTLLQDVALIQPDATDFLVSVSTVRQDTQLLYSIPNNTVQAKSSATSQGLAAACILLVMALIFVSTVLVWIAGGFPVLKENFINLWYNISSYWSSIRAGSGDNNKRNNTMADDDATTASGILGAVPSYEQDENDMPPGFTPNRGVFREQDCDDSAILSPMSTNTDYSTASRTVVPLGIMPSLHLRHNTPQKGDNLSNPYFIKRDLTYT